MYDVIYQWLCSCHVLAYIYMLFSFLFLQLRSSFNRAFYKKGSKSYSDIEEIATPESSTPSSPKIHHDVEKPPFSLNASTSASSSG